MAAQCSILRSITLEHWGVVGLGASYRWLQYLVTVRTPLASRCNSCVQALNCCSTILGVALLLLPPPPLPLCAAAGSAVFQKREGALLRRKRAYGDLGRTSGESQSRSSKLHLKNR